MARDRKEKTGNYFLDNIYSDRMSFGNELSEFDHEVASVGPSLLLQLMDKNTVKGVEKRAHKRFRVNNDAFALIRPAASAQLHVANRSMAEIACSVYRSKPVRFGRIDNISMGGLSFRYISGEERSNQSLVLDLLVAESGFYLENLTFKNISDFEMDDEFVINSFKMRLNRVQFEKLEASIVVKLRRFIKNYGVSGV